MEFEWDYEKNKRNIKIHNIRFETAMNVFKDKYRLEYFDEEHSQYEERYKTIGMVNGFITVITVIYTNRKDVIRIISARKANKEEREDYYDSKKKTRS